MMKLLCLIATLLWTHHCVLSHDEIVDGGVPATFQEYDQEAVGKELKTHTSVFFVETFNDKDALASWILSKSKKKTEDGSTLQYDGDWLIGFPAKDALPNDMGLTFAAKAKHRAISAKLFRDYVFGNRPFVIQYEVLHQDGQECGGAYLKLISKERPIADLNEFNDKTPYSIMFGPDKCGTTNKLHFIFQHKNPLNGSFEEKHCKPPQTRIDETFTDSKPHLFRLVLHPDSTFSISVDHKIINEGSLLEDFEPPVNPPKVIDDPNDKKPAAWDDREKIPDPSAKKPDEWDEDAPAEIPDANAVKPEGWLEDEPINISDPSAEKPDDWDDEMDGEWEAPLVPNPACEDAPGCGPWAAPLVINPDYRGKWSPPLINNPDFKGIWYPRKIPNPDFFEDKHPFHTMSTIDAVGFELWSVSSKILFDNIIITDDENVAKQFASVTYDKKILNIEKSADTLLSQFVAFTNRYPWLWAIYIVVLLIPITLIVVCCFWNSKDNDAQAKKNDDFLQSSNVDETSYSSISSPESKDDKDQKAKRKDARDDEEFRSSSVTDTDTGSVESEPIHEDYQVEANGDKSARKGSEERKSETKELAKNISEGHSGEQSTKNEGGDEDVECVSERGSNDDKGDEHSAHESSAEPEMVLKKRK